jgi:hypothetical protein
MNEQLHRLSNFGDFRSCSVVLCDGQHWYFPLPCPEVYTSDVVARMGAVRCCKDGPTFLSGVMVLACPLLSSLYDLSEAELDELLNFRVGDPRSRTAAMGIWSVASYSENFSRLA